MNGSTSEETILEASDRSDSDDLIGFLENVITTTEFEEFRAAFLEEHKHVFADQEEENSHGSMAAFEAWRSGVESFLQSRLGSLPLSTCCLDEDSEVQELLRTLFDFQEFKKMVMEEECQVDLGESLTTTKFKGSM